MRLCARVSTINAILHRVQRLTFTSQTFAPTCLIFQLIIIFVRPRAYIEAARHNGEKRRLDGEQHLIYREILRSRHRETIHSGTTVTFQTRTAIVSVSRYRAGDWRWVTLSLVYLHNDEQTNEPTKKRNSNSGAFALARDDIRCDPRCTTYAPRVQSRASTIHTSRWVNPIAR